MSRRPVLRSAPSVAWSTALVRALLALSLTVPAPLSAQAATAVIEGVVRDTDARPLAGVVVVARHTATGFEATGRSNPSGAFVLRQLPLGGPYTVTARAIGHRAEQRTGLELALNDRIVLAFRLPRASAELAPVVVAADQADTRTRRLGASTLVTAEDIRTLPVLNRNFGNLTAITPLANGNNLMGMRGTSTAFQIDGASVRQNRLGESDAGGGSIMSIEAVREFEVATNEYDVAQGRQGGGAITAATKFGTNRVTGSAFSYLRNERLTTANYVGRAPDDFTQWQYGGSLGGPILRDRLHFFLAAERRDQRSPAFLFDLRNLEDEKAGQISRDSLARFLDIVGRVYGTDRTVPQVGQFSLPVVNDMLFTRLDWQPHPRHRVTLRGNYVAFDGGNLTGPGPGIFEAKGRERQRTLTAALAVRSTVAGGLLNDLTLQVTDVDFTRTPNAGYLPVGLVRVRSTLADGTATNRQLQFGGNRNMPANLPEQQLQLVNKTIWDVRGATVTLGTDNLLTRYRDEFVAQEQLGRFEFNSLAELEARRPARFVRQVPLRTTFPAANQTSLDVALFGQVELRPHPRLTAVLGLRYDVTRVMDTPGYNRVADSTLGVRTDRMPVDGNNLLPRAQLTWDVRGDQRDVVKVGGGAFTALPHGAPYYNAMLFNGTQLADINVTGTAVPIPDYAAYRANPASIPGIPAGVTAAPAQVELLGPQFQNPFTWKANAAYSRRMGRRLTVSANLLWNRTRDNYAMVNRNLVEQPYFTIEGGRPVYVPAASIPATGVVNPVANRRTPAVAEVFELTSTAAAEQKAMVLEAVVSLPRRAAVTLSYTASEARDNNAWNCCLSGTSINTPVKGDPRDLAGSWGTSVWNVGRKVIVYGTLPAVWGIQVSGRYVGSTGAPYSLLVNADVNGDGVLTNDLAFVFDPDHPTTPPAVAAAMRKVLDNPENRAAACMRTMVGRIADRNACTSPWSGRIDAKVSTTVTTWRGQSAEITAEIFNVASLVNREWGGAYDVGNINLYTVTGFNRTTQQFAYAINEAAGVTRKGGTPYQIQLGVRYGF